MLRFYLTPHHITDGRRPLYFSTLEGPDWAADYNGLADLCLVGCDLIEDDHALIASKPDVYCLPPDLDSPMGGAQADAMAAYMEARNIPFPIPGTITPRQAVRMARIAFRIGWRVGIEGDETMEPENRGALLGNLGRTSAKVSWVTPSLTWRSHWQLLRHTSAFLNNIPYDDPDLGRAVKRLRDYPQERLTQGQLELFSARMDLHKVEKGWLRTATGQNLLDLEAVSWQHHNDLGDWENRFSAVRRGMTLDTRVADVLPEHRQNLVKAAAFHRVDLSGHAGSIRDLYAGFVAGFPADLALKIRGVG